MGDNDYRVLMPGRTKPVRTTDRAIALAQVKPDYIYFIDEDTPELAAIRRKAEDDIREKERRESAVKVYTDGSYRMGMGGWAWWNEDTDDYASGVECPSTNQRMELYAAIDAIASHMYDDELVIISDSEYVVNAFNQGWYQRWLANNWRNAKRKPVENQDLWEKLIKLYEAHGHVHFEWTRGHVGTYGNEMADKLAVKAVLLANGDC